MDKLQVAKRQNIEKLIDKLCKAKMEQKRVLILTREKTMKYFKSNWETVELFLVPEDGSRETR